MASWDLCCRNCGKDFTYSQIGDTLLDFFIPSRPEMPPKGVERECLTCKAKATYQQTEINQNPMGRATLGNGAGKSKLTETNSDSEDPCNSFSGLSSGA